MAKLDCRKLGKEICDAMRMGRKPNPGIKLAEKEFGRGIVGMVLKKKKGFALEDFLPRQREMVKKMMDLKYGPLVYKSTDGRLMPKPEVGETLGLSYTDTDARAKAIAEEVRNECWRRGCHVALRGGNDAEARLYYQSVPEDTITEMPPIVETRAKTIDVTISIGDKQQPDWTKGLEKRLLMGAPSGQALHQILDKRNVRWCLVGFPVKMSKRKYYLVPPNTYEKVYLESIRQTYTKETQKLCKYYYNALKGKDSVHITANDGTDLSFSIKGRPILVDDGILDDADMARGDVGLNIPSGEAFIAPLEHSANGKIFFDYVNIPGFGHVKGGLWATFKDGKMVKYKAKHNEGNAIFRKFLDSNTGEKDRIAELGIGTNKGARFIGTIVVDEKIYGTVHIAIGVNTGAYHGKNEASSHLDMIKQMKGRDGTMTVDGKVVMRDGEPVGKV